VGVQPARARMNVDINGLHDESVSCAIEARD
jgi:hypothetical protein